MLGYRIRRLAIVGATLLAVTLCGTVADAKAPYPKFVTHTRTRAVLDALKSSRLKLRSYKASASLALIVKKPNDAPDFDFRKRINEAQALLATQPVLKDDMQLDGKGGLTHFVWLLAVGQKDGPLSVVRMDEAGNNTQGFAVTWPTDNFINTHFKVTKPDGYIVFAQRRPVHAGQGYQEAVYTSYAPELDTKTMRQAGMEYLHQLQRQAYDQIKSNDVRSRVAPDITVAQEIPDSMILRLMITEHIDPLHMQHVGMEQCIHEVLFTLAADQGHAYAYAKSSAGALGLPQFMQSSYEIVRKNYPTAQLKPDFEGGMKDLSNAILASALLLDLELTSLPRGFLKKFTGSSQQFAAFLAAGYNRNPVHVLQTYRRTHSFTGGHAPAENKMYVRIQDWVGNFLKKEYGLAWSAA